MSMFKRFIALALVLFMFLGLAPLSAFAATETEEFIRVFHLDVGRKYFTVAQVTELIDLISAKGYTHMELAIGNDGLRFLLDDMSVTVNGTTYDSDTIKEGVREANADYSHSGEWSQTEMDSIMAYAASKHIEIIPLVNNPGHMDGILGAMSAVGINGYYAGSSRTVDLENAAAVAFTQALVLKYARYFQAKGCTYFNIGADEYANDFHTSDSTGMGFGYLIDNDMYGNFITYVNTLTAAICDLGMTPIAFNDGIYFRSNTSFGTFDNRLVIAAWSGGWGGIKPASTTFLAEKGHKILNTNERWYYVLGRAQSVDSTYCYESALSNAQSVPVTSVTDNTGAESMGAMQCVWCDDPSVDYATYKANVVNIINAFADSNPDYFVPYTVPEVTDNDVTVSADGVETMTAQKQETSVPSLEHYTASVTYDIQINGGEYHDAAQIKIPYDPVFDGCISFMGVVDGKDTFPVSLVDGYFIGEVPHFSIITIEGTSSVNVRVKVGENSDTYRDETGYHTVAEGLDTTIATVALGGSNGNEPEVTYSVATPTCHTLISSNATQQATGYYYKNGENYYPLYATRTSSTTLIWTTYTYTWWYSTDNGASFTQIGTQSTRDRTDEVNITVYSQTTTEAVDPYTEIVFTGVKPGTTSAKIGNVTYNITVWGDVEITVNYIADGKTVMTEKYTVSSDAETYTLPSSITVGGKSYSIENRTLTLTDATEYNVTVVERVDPLELEFWITNHPVQPNETEGFDFLVSYEDHEGETQANEQRIYLEIDANAAVKSENGAPITNYIVRDGIDSHLPENEVGYWKTVVLDVASNQQTTVENDNETADGTIITAVRYWANGWEVYDSARKTWISFTADHQLVAYYLQIQTVTNQDVIRTETVDWGEVYGVSGYGDTNFVALDFAIQYEDGVRNPDSFAVDGKTLMFHCDYNNALNQTVFRDESYTSSREYYRRIGSIHATESAGYEVYMITLTPNSDDVDDAVASRASYINTINYGGTEKVVWVDDEANLGKFEDTALQHADFHVGGEPTVEKVDIYNQQAVLVTYYVRAKVTEDALFVHYMDETAGGIEFYNYNIAVQQGTYFDEDIALPNLGGEDPWKGDLVNGTVQTIDPNVKQTVSSDLSTMPKIEAQYQYSQYECVRIEKVYTTLEDGTRVLKDVYLYYTFNPTVVFVADYGLPIQITGEDLSASLSGIVSSIEYTGGSYTDYGRLSVSGKTLTYTPTTIMTGIDFFTVLVTTTKEVEGILDEAASQIAFRVYVLPATTVNYEEGFISWGSGWTGATTGTGYQDTERQGEKKNNYGYQSDYVNGSAAVATAIGSTGTFTFTGTGFDLYANCTETSGSVYVQVKDANGKSVKLFIVNTVVDGEGSATSGQTGNLNSLPIVSWSTETYGTYTVTVKKIADEKTVAIDGLRIYGTIQEPETGTSPYAADLEDAPAFYELRDYVLYAIGIKINQDVAGTSVDYKPMLEQVYAGISSNGEAPTAAAIITDEKVSYQDSASLQDLLDNGPKNEIYLYPGQTLTFKVNTNRVMQVGLKAPAGETKYSINGAEAVTLAQTTDMFYTAAAKITTATEQTISIKNAGEKILSVTDLKICDDPNASFEALTEEDIKNILLDAGYEEKAPITISAQPTNVEAAEGEKVSTTVTAEGEELTYQWYVKNATGTKFSVSSVTGPTYSCRMSEKADGRQVYCVITDKDGNTVQTETVTLTMTRTELAITAQPQDVTVDEGKKASTTVVAEGDGLTYQWYLKNATGTKFSKSSVTSATYSCKMSQKADGRQVYCVITDRYGNTVQSETATLSMTAPIVITAQPTEAVAKIGATVKTTVVAEGEGLTYQWYVKNTTGSKFSKSSITSATYSCKMSQKANGREVYCVITDAKGNTLKTETVKLYAAATVAGCITRTTVESGEKAVVTVDALGKDLTYTWYYANEGSDAFVKTGSFTGDTYSVKMTAARNGRQVYCVVTDAFGNEAKTEVFTLTIG